MSNTKLPLKEYSINELFISGEKATYEIPIYQRNYAWEKDEISALIQDVYDSYNKNKNEIYYIGTLVSFNKGDMIFEVIDGQQRLTTIRLILAVLDVDISHKLTYHSRKKSDDTLKSIPAFKNDEKDFGIINGYKYALHAYEEIVEEDKRGGFIQYFLNNVHIIHYQVPKDIDLNHYFEIMNSRGEQLEKHEIVKAKLLSEINTEDSQKFASIWEACSNMSCYIQRTFIDGVDNFGSNQNEFTPSTFDEIICKSNNVFNRKTINEILNSDTIDTKSKTEKPDTFQPIIDFSNFLLIVLKITRLQSDNRFSAMDFNLDDKELLNEFDKVEINTKFSKQFSYNLLKAKFFLDNYIVHHSNEDETIDSNPWKLETLAKVSGKIEKKNLCEVKSAQDELVQLLSMFEVSFTARQRKNYLFYCLYYLFTVEALNTDEYLKFIRSLADKYFHNVYLVSSKLNSINTPTPGSFDEEMIIDGKIDTVFATKTADAFIEVYGDGTETSAGIPLFVFNYLDYKLWNYYLTALRGEKTRKASAERKAFFEQLGCSDFELDIFNNFYFSRTRRSLEHYYPQHLATGKDNHLTEEQINCFGNYAMIGSEMNSSGSDWSPITKLSHYLDTVSGKVKQTSVASLKFMIMMQSCKDNQDNRDKGQEWIYTDIKIHQNNMLNILFGNEKE